VTTEVFANNASTTLSAAITTTGATSCTVTSASAPFPTTGNFRIIIDSELMIVTAVSGTTFTITRGAEGTTAATHSNGATVTSIVTKGAIQALQSTRPRVTNTSHAVYTIDSTGNNPDVEIWHNLAGNASYLLPPPSDSRHIEWIDQTAAIGTPANWVSFVPNAGEKINGSTGLALSGTAYHFTNGSANVSCTSGAFTKELYVGASIASSNQAGVNYVVSSITDDTHLVLTANFTGTTTTTATATRTSLLVAANGVRMTIGSDGTDWWIHGDGRSTTISFAGAGTYTFVPPAGTAGGYSEGCGGGGGGAGGANGVAGASGGNGGAGGGAGFEIRLAETWTGNTLLSVVVGGGGTAGAASGGTGGNGGNTTFNGKTRIGASGGASTSRAGNSWQTITSNSSTLAGNQVSPTSITTTVLPGMGGVGGNGGSSANGFRGSDGLPGFAFLGGTGGNGGTAHTNGGGGGGAGGGSSARGTGGTGGTGGDGQSGIAGSGGTTSGTTPTANSAAGGGGGGGGGGGSTGGTGAAAQAGADAYLDVIYIL